MNMDILASAISFSGIMVACLIYYFTQYNQSTNRAFDRIIQKCESLEQWLDFLYDDWSSNKKYIETEYFRRISFIALYIRRLEDREKIFVINSSATIDMLLEQDIIEFNSRREFDFISENIRENINKLIYSLESSLNDLEHNKNVYSFDKCTMSGVFFGFTTLALYYYIIKNL